MCVCWEGGFVAAGGGGSPFLPRPRFGAGGGVVVPLPSSPSRTLGPTSALLALSVLSILMRLLIGVAI